LGYWYSPKWYKLNSNFLLNILLFIYNININVIVSIFSFMFIISFILFYLDNFKLSIFYCIKFIQIISFISILFICLLFMYNNIISIDTILFIKDNENDIHLHGHVSIDKDTGKAIGQGMNTIGSQIGLGATMVGVGTAVGKAVSKASLPPLQKAGFIVGSALVAGVGHSWISSVNRNAITAENATITTTYSISGSDINSRINKFIDDSHISPLQEFLFNGEMMNYVCLGLIYLLIIQLVFKLYFKDTINLNLLKLLGNNANKKIEFYLNKIIKLNKQMSVVWIWFGFITIMFGLSISIYALHNICANMDSFINVHISLNPNLTNNSTYIPNKSIIDILLNLKVINYISIIAMISLMLQVILKFHFNKNINNIYIWLTLSILILALAFSAHTYGDLYTHIDSYVNMYINLRN